MVFIKSDDGSLADFNSPLYLEEASLSRIRLRSDNKSMEKHLYRGRVKGGGVFNLLPIPEVTIW